MTDYLITNTDRHMNNIAVMDFSLYEQDVTERRIRIPKLKELYERKLDKLAAFQRGTDIWKDHRSRH